LNNINRFNMNRLKIILGFCILFGLTSLSQAQQKVYMTSGGEIIFSFGDIQLNDQWVANNTNTLNGQAPSIVKNPMRFTLFLHIGQFVHFDLGNNVGFFSGINLRNTGIITDETLPTQYLPANERDNLTYQDVRVIRRAYSVGIPLALKLGSFKDHFYMYGGGEIDYQFHFKEKYWLSHSRSNSKSKHTEWWPSQLEAFQPSIFLGIQLPNGINIKGKYFLENFLNHKYTSSTNDPGKRVISDLTKYEKSNLFYISLSYHFNTSKITKSYTSNEVASLY
jgi:hypothetical protein